MTDGHRTDRRTKRLVGAQATTLPKKKTINRSAARGQLASLLPNFIVVTHFWWYKKYKVNGEFPYIFPIVYRGRKYVKHDIEAVRHRYRGVLAEAVPLYRNGRQFILTLISRVFWTTISHGQHSFWPRKDVEDILKIVRVIAIFLSKKK